MEKSKTHCYEIIVNGTKCLFRSRMDLPTLINEIENSKWIGDNKSAFRCASIDSIYILNEE